VRSTLSEMNGKAKPLSLTPLVVFFFAPVNHLVRNILLNLKRDSETALAWDQALPRVRAFVCIPAGEQVQRIQQVKRDVAALLSNSKILFKQVAPWAKACSI